MRGSLMLAGLAAAAGIACGSSSGVKPALSDLPPAAAPSVPPAGISSGPPAALILEWYSAGGRLFPVGATGDSVGQPVEPRQAAHASASADGTLVALSDVFGLAVYRVDRWELLFTANDIYGPVLPLWAHDVSRIYVIRSDRLLEVAVPGGVVREVGRLTSPQTTAALSPDASTLFALSYEGDQYGIDAREVHLSAIDTVTGQLRARLELPSVILGQRKEKSASGEYYATYMPALALSPDGRRAYVAQADSQQVTVVDLERMAVESTASLTAPRSRWARLRAAAGGLFVTSARAKGGASFRREAQISPDGRWLYVTGTVARMCGFFACEDEEPAGLFVFDTRSMRVVHWEDGINHIAVSPGGNLVAGTGTSFKDQGGVVGRGVKVLQAGTWQRLVHWQPSAPFGPPVFSRAGDQVFVVEPGPGLAYAHSNRGQCQPACHVLRVLDPATGTVTASRDFFGFFVELVALPGGQ